MSDKVPNTPLWRIRLFSQRGSIVDVRKYASASTTDIVNFESDKPLKRCLNYFEKQVVIIDIKNLAYFSFFYVVV